MGRCQWVRDLSLAAVVFLSSSVWAAGVLSTENNYYPAAFYSDLDNGMRGERLRETLFTILSQVHVRSQDHDQVVSECPKGSESKCYKQINLGYSKARKVMFGKIHLVNTRSGYGVLDVYCQELATAEDFKHDPPGPDQIPDAAVLNTEHSWPQSHFSKNFSKDAQKADLHILYPVLSTANSSRSNLKYGDVVTPVSQPCDLSKRGYIASGSSELYFEPPAIHKGNAARAVFYFSVRYKMPISAEEEASLRAWNKADPVDDFEKGRNDAIFDAQKERNPFIDHPELADLISDF